jgi:hypothetical protein
MSETTIPGWILGAGRAWLALLGAFVPLSKSWNAPFSRAMRMDP